MSLHDLSTFCSPEYPDPHYDPSCNRLFATDGETVICVPTDGEHAASSTPFPDVTSVFPESSPQVFIPIDPSALLKVATYATQHCTPGEPLWLALSPSGTSEFVQPNRNVMFFCVANDTDSRKLVSGVINTPTVSPSCRKQIIGQSDFARQPRVSASIVLPAPEPLIARYSKFLQQHGFTVLPPAPPRPEKRTAKTAIRFTSLLQAISAKDALAVSRFIAAGVTHADTDANGNHPLIHAALFATPEIINQLAAAAPHLLNQPDGKGVWTPLMHAIAAGKADNSRALLTAGATFTERNRDEMGEDYIEAVEATIRASECQNQS
jgi:hypothetical protein